MKPKERHASVPAAIVALQRWPFRTAGAATPRLEPPTVTGSRRRQLSSRLAQCALDAAPRRLAGCFVLGRQPYTVAIGETVTVYVSTRVPRGRQRRPRNGRSSSRASSTAPSSALLTAYIAPLAEVQEMCGSESVIGCYWGQTLVTVGDSSRRRAARIDRRARVRPSHRRRIAATRLWPAIDWGTKRWATPWASAVCVASGHRRFPGDEGVNYAFNPGEAFAESYRVLVETNGAASCLRLADRRPKLPSRCRSALAALREDVLHPWAEPTSKTIRARFRRHAAHLDVPRSRRRSTATLRVTGQRARRRRRRRESSFERRQNASRSGNLEQLRREGARRTRVCGSRSVRVRVLRSGRTGTAFTSADHNPLAHVHSEGEVERSHRLMSQRPAAGRRSRERCVTTTSRRPAAS